MVGRMTHPWSTIERLTDINLDGVEAVAADVDHTVFDFDTAHAAAIEAVGRKFTARLGAALGETFDLVLAGSRTPDAQAWDRRPEFDAMLNEIAGFEPESGAARVRKWSRERWMQVINKREKLGMRPEDIRDASRHYWHTLGGSGGIYPDADAFMRRLAKNDVPLVLMTASDGALKLCGDEFVYVPEYAKAMKVDRLQQMEWPVSPAGVVIGDPHDKPSKEFYDLVEDAVLKAGAANVGRAVSVGDSLKGDVEVPVERGYRAYHIARNGH